LLDIPFFSGTLESRSFKTKIGKVSFVKFEKPFKEVYDVSFCAVEGVTDMKVFRETKFKAVEMNSEGFFILSSTFNESFLNKDVEIAYFARGRRPMQNIPIWHIFLQYAINAINQNQYSIAIVQCVSAFDAFLDDFLIRQFIEKRHLWTSGTSEKVTKSLRQIIKNCGRGDKLYYFLNYLTGKSFKDSPYDDEMEKITESNAREALSIIIQSMNWINSRKF